MSQMHEGHCYIKCFYNYSYGIIFNTCTINNYNTNRYIHNCTNNFIRTNKYGDFHSANNKVELWSEWAVSRNRTSTGSMALCSGTLSEPGSSTWAASLERRGGNPPEQLVGRIIFNTCTTNNYNTNRHIHNCSNNCIRTNKYRDFHSANN
eukprot:g39807.t1